MTEDITDTTPPAPAGPTVDPAEAAAIAALVAEAKAIEARSSQILQGFAVQGVQFDPAAIIHTRLAVLVEGLLGPHEGPDATRERAQYELDVQQHVAAMVERTAGQIRQAQIAAGVPRQNGHGPAGGLILPGRN